MKSWLVFIFAGIGTYLTRASFIAFGAGVELPTWLQRALKYVAPAVFAAIALPAVVTGGANPDVIAVDARLVAAAIATGVAMWTKNLTWVLAIGMSTLWVLQWIGL